jgi:hypothetical protein
MIGSNDMWRWSRLKAKPRPPFTIGRPLPLWPDLCRRRVWIDEGSYRYFCHMYIILDGPPGIKKSTAINQVMDILQDVPGVKFGSDCATWQEFVQQVEDAKDVFAEANQQSKNLLDREYTVTCALTLGLGEFGTFFNPQIPEMVSTLTGLWDGLNNRAWVKATKTQGDNVLMNPFVNLIAGTTPKWLADNFKGYFGGWGLSSRIIFVYADTPERHIASPGEMWKGKYQEIMGRFREDLIEISKMQGEMILEPAALAFFDEWYNVHHAPRRDTIAKHTNTDEWLSYYLARKADHVKKLSIVIAASRRPDLIITEGDISDATRKCDAIEDELALVFGVKDLSSRYADLNKKVWKYIHALMCQHGRLPARRVFGYTLSFMRHNEAKDLLSHLTSAGYLATEQDAEGVWYVFGPVGEASITDGPRPPPGDPAQSPVVVPFQQSRRDDSTPA